MRIGHPGLGKLVPFHKSSLQLPTQFTPIGWPEDRDLTERTEFVVKVGFDSTGITSSCLMTDRDTTFLAIPGSISG